MTPTEQLEIAPVPVSIDNSGEWETFAQQLSSEDGEPTVVTPDVLAGMIGSALPLLFAADRGRDMNVLRGTFSDPVIAQCERNAGCLGGGRPVSAVVHLVGTPIEEGHPGLRAHLAVAVQGADGAESASGQFWDLQLGAQTTVGEPTCPNCGAPIAPGHLICEHCGTDVRSAISVPLIVGKLELY